MFPVTLGVWELYRKTSVSFQILSNQFNLPQVNINPFIERSQGHLTGKGMHLISSSNVESKHMNTYVTVVFVKVKLVYAFLVWNISFSFMGPKRFRARVLCNKMRKR